MMILCISLRFQRTKKMIYIYSILYDFISTNLFPLDVGLETVDRHKSELNLTLKFCVTRSPISIPFSENILYEAEKANKKANYDCINKPILFQYSKKSKRRIC